MDTFITGATRLVALLGYPVAHSLSPQIHNHAFRSLGLPYAYIPLCVPPGKLANTVQTLRDCGFAGANVTIPYKQEVLSYCDHLSDLSKKIGAVNTLYFRDGLLYGTTTDPEGFLRALQSMGHDPKGDRIVILGNGGTARTLASALALNKIPASLTLAGRTLGKIEDLAIEISDSFDFPVGISSLDKSDLHDLLSQATLLVNCTSAGMHPNIDQTPIDKKHFHAKLTVFDTIYNPNETRFLREARESGCAVQNGLRMLLFQGLASSKLWTGEEVPESLFSIDELQRLISSH